MTTVDVGHGTGRSVNISRIGWWLLAAVLATGVALSSHAITKQVRSPASACASPVGPTGAACANLAAASYIARRERDAKATVLPLEKSLARKGYAAEPLSANALAVLTFAAEGAARAQFLENAGKVTRRNTLINFEQVQFAGTRDDKPAFFLWLSRSILTSDEARKSYVSVIAEATALDGAIEALAPVLGRAPAWTRDYWVAIIQRPKSQANAAQLRMDILRAPWRQSEVTETDKRLVLELVNNMQFDTAFELAGALSPRGTSKAGRVNRLANGDFASQPFLAPFDWDLATSGNLGASIEVDRKRLLVSAIGGAQGMAARQLIRIPSGSYVLEWTLSGGASDISMPLDARIACAERGGAAEPVSVKLVPGRRQARFDLGSRECNWYWFTINVTLPDDAAGIDAYLQDISLVSATGSVPRPQP